jgi:hypothetical protein
MALFFIYLYTGFEPTPILQILSTHWIFFQNTSTSLAAVPQTVSLGAQKIIHSQINHLGNRYHLPHPLSPEPTKLVVVLRDSPPRS